MPDLTEDEKQELCLKCLACCRIIGIPLGYRNGNQLQIEKEFYNARGVEIILDTRYTAVNYMAVVPYPCPHLTAFGCAIYGDHPLVCKKYDGRDDPLMKDYCLWIKENRKDA